MEHIHAHLMYCLWLLLYYRGTVQYLWKRFWYVPKPKIFAAYSFTEAYWLLGYNVFPRTPNLCKIFVLIYISTNVNQSITPLTYNLWISKLHNFCLCIEWGKKFSVWSSFAFLPIVAKLDIFSCFLLLIFPFCKMFDVSSILKIFYPMSQ